MPSEAVHAVAVGTVIDDTYEVVGLLGRGGMGTVWLARHRRVPKKVAIKVLHQSAAADAQALARFRREAEVASRLGHPGIVEVLDFATLPSGEPYLVLEHLDGESLAARVARGALPVDEALDVARQLGSALAAAHRQGVVHRDLKPENVFLIPRDRDGRLRHDVKVLDFGISKIQGSQTLRTQEAVLVGTPQYMAPEQATGKNEQVDARSDQFALAAIVHEMLSGKPPWAAASIAETLFKVVYEPAPALDVPGLASTAKAAIERALAKAPAERWPDVAAFVHALTGSPLVSLDRAPVLSDPGADALGETVDSGQGQPALGAMPATLKLPDAPLVPPATVLPRQVTPAPTTPDSRPPTIARKKPKPFAVLALAGILGAVIALVLARRNTRKVIVPPAPTPVVAGSVDAARVIPPAPPDAAVATTPAAVDPPVKPPKPRHDPDDDEAAPKNGLEHPDVTAARAALDAGNPAEAKRLALRALRDKAGPGARRVLVLVGCAEKDLAQVQAWMAKLPLRWRASTLRQCRALGFEP